MRVQWLPLVAALLLRGASTSTADDLDACPATNLWADLLEEWATSAHEQPGRQGRVMALPPTKGYYVTERIDGPLTPPPPPPHGPHHPGPHGSSPGSYGPGSHGSQYGPNSHGPTGQHSGPNSHGPLGQHSGHPNTYGPSGQHPGQHSGQHGSQHNQQKPAPDYSQYDEWKATPPPPPGASKVVNRPPNPYKDKFKPSYQVPNTPPAQSIPISQPWGGAADRVDSPPTPPTKQVSETDLYLLTAIEKLVYRADLMEKRLRRLEDTMHYLVAGKEAKPDPCAGNFTRVGSSCYWVSGEAGDWKAASLRCRKLRAHLLEINAPQQKRALLATLLGNENYKGKDFWTGGLNPGLLWIWSHSARPVNGTNGSDGPHGPDGPNGPAGATAASGASIVGAGRCLALVHDAAAATYVYRGEDCALRHRYICELPENREKISNEIDRAARELRLVATTARQARTLVERREAVTTNR